MGFMTLPPSELIAEVRRSGAEIHPRGDAGVGIIRANRLPQGLMSAIFARECSVRLLLDQEECESLPTAGGPRD